MDGWMDGWTDSFKNTQDEIKLSKQESKGVINMDYLVEGGRKGG